MTTTSPENRNWRRMLAAVPTHNAAAKVIEKGDAVTIIIKNIKPAYMKPPVSWFVPFKPQREITLDKMGTELWKKCDGKRTVETIIDLFKDHYDLTFHEAKTCVVDYLKQLVKRGILAVIVDPHK